MAETGKYVALVKDGNRMMLLPVDDWLQFSKVRLCKTNKTFDRLKAIILMNLQWIKLTNN